MSSLTFRNRQKTRAIDLQLLRKITGFLLKDLRAKDSYTLGFHFVAEEEMATVNETFLQHSGSTDVITFDYHEEKGDAGLYGEIFICIDDALAQAKEFGTTWQSELVRYIVHGILHLEGFDDLNAAARKKMKAQENRLVKELDGHFHFRRLERKSKKAR